MDPEDVWLQIGAIIALLGLSAFFSSVEGAYFSLNRSTLDSMQDSSDPRARRVWKLLSNSRLLLATILTGNTIVNTIAASISALLAEKYALANDLSPTLTIVLEVAVFTLVILFLGELFPKLISLRHAERWAIMSGPVLLVFSWILYPLAQPLAWMTNRMTLFLGVERQKGFEMSSAEILALVQVGHEHGALEETEKEMIHSIFQFGDTIAREIMIPRIDIVAVERSDPYEKLIHAVIEHGHSRIPVYDKDIDHIIGMVHAKDLIGETAGEDFDINAKLRKVHFIPEEKKIDDLFRELQKEKVHLAIVLDEYGGTSGMVTMEDIIEEIVGEIQDEYDLEPPLYNRVDENTIIVSGKIGISDLNELFDTDIMSDDEAYDTLAGFLFNQLGVIPSQGAQCEYNGYKFVVEEVSGRRIVTVKIIKRKGLFEDV